MPAADTRSQRCNQGAAREGGPFFFAVAALRRGKFFWTAFPRLR